MATRRPSTSVTERREQQPQNPWIINPKGYQSLDIDPYYGAVPLPARTSLSAFFNIYSRPAKDRCGLMVAQKTAGTRPVSTTVQTGNVETDIAARYSIVQSSTEERTELLSRIWRFLSENIPQQCLPEQIARVLIFESNLGTGAYGTVCRAAITDPRVTQFPIAIKYFSCEPPVDRAPTVEFLLGGTDYRSRSKSDLTDRQKQRVREYQYGQFLNSQTEVILSSHVSELVIENRSPNFPVVYYWCYVPAIQPSDECATYMFYELADNNVERRPPLATAEEALALCFQVLAGIWHMAYGFGITNNDLYLKNVLYNRCAEDTIDYVIGETQTQYRVRNYSHLYKITDFSLGRSAPLAAHYDIPALNERFDVTNQPVVAEAYTKTSLLNFSSEIPEAQLLRGDPRAYRGRELPAVLHTYMPEFATDPIAFLSDAYRGLTFVARNERARFQTWCSGVLTRPGGAFSMLSAGQRPAGTTLLGGEPYYRTANTTNPEFFGTPEGTATLIALAYSPEFLENNGRLDGTLIFA